MSDQSLNWFWRRQGAQKIAEIAGQGMKAGSEPLGRERPARQPRSPEVHNWA